MRTVLERIAAWVLSIASDLGGHVRPNGNLPAVLGQVVIRGATVEKFGLDLEHKRVAGVDGVAGTTTPKPTRKNPESVLKGPND